MFRIVVEGPVTGPSAGRAIIDEGRETRITWMRGYRDGSDIFRMQWNGRDIQFRTVLETDPPAENPRRRHIVRIGAVVASNSGDNDFRDEDERERALNLAAEAMLVYGAGFDGLRQPNGKWTSSYFHRGELLRFTLSDFGYRADPG